MLKFLPKPLRYLLRWILFAAAVGILAGSASALLLVSLNIATETRDHHFWLIYFLGPVGLIVGLLYHFFGRTVEGGSNMIIDEIHTPRAVIPLRMTPLILLGTFLSHLFGASVGREGTAIQTGASLADQLSIPLGLTKGDRRILLMTGVSAGFASVFGTPLAGAVFGFEVLAVGTVNYEALAPCFLAAFAGDLVTRAWRVHHTLYTVSSVPAASILSLLCAALAGIVFGLTALAFVRTTRAISTFAKRHIAFAPLRPFAGGILVTLAILATGTTRYIGLGIPTIVAAFHGLLFPWDFAGKFAFTTVSLGAGLKGGEVTPLFYIGATLGNALSRILPLPSSLLAGMGFVAVFAGAANTPIASTLMACELFGAEAGAFAGIACVVSYLFSGSGSIYGTQRPGVPKSGSLAEEAKIKEN